MNQTRTVGNSDARMWAGIMKLGAISLSTILFVFISALPALAADPLPSWNDGPAKRSMINFVEKGTKPGSPDFVLSRNASPPSTMTARSGVRSRYPCSSSS